MTRLKIFLRLNFLHSRVGSIFKISRRTNMHYCDFNMDTGINPKMPDEFVPDLLNLGRDMRFFTRRDDLFFRRSGIIYRRNEFQERKIIFLRGKELTISRQ